MKITTRNLAHPNRDVALRTGLLEIGFSNVIDGRRVPSGPRLTISDPVTGESLAEVCDTQAKGLNDAVEAAAAAFPAWSQSSWGLRRKVLSDAIDVLKVHRDELANLLTAENGRPLSMAHFEIDWILDTYVPALLQLELAETQRMELGLGEVTQRYIPLGVVAAISPWNLPFWLSFTKVLPALLAGNTVVLKPAVSTPLTVLRAVDRIKSILPAGSLNVISGGDHLGPLMTEYPAFRKVSFTGSSETGRKVFESGAPTLKHLTLELGGNDPGIVLPDADPEAIANDLFRSMFAFSGQGCITLKRLFVPTQLYARLSAALVECAQQQKLGDGFDPETTFGPIQNRAQFLRLQETWREIEASGAPVLFRGDAPKDGAGLFFPITLLDNPPADAPYVQRENFGPLRAIMKYDDVNEAVRLANGTSYGLGASVWGKDPSALMSVARRLDAGTVWINQHLNVHPNVAFNGRKDSGVGVEFGVEGLKEFCSIQILAERQ
jgi:acyl-CoA reductase-like NAD-dependent aldehyde dehydrogenase